jgi:acylphosphatase
MIVATDDSPERRDVVYRGMVQGVGFRYTARRIAARFPVTGYVQNLPDGQVRLVAEGSRGTLDRFLAAVQAELGRFIDDATPTIRPVTGEFRQFDIRY